VLPICTVATVQLLYAIPILTVTISVHTVTNMYGSHSCYSFYKILYTQCRITGKERTLNPIIETHSLVKYFNSQEVESKHFRNVHPRVRIHLHVERVK
jgi:uncharacterized protein with PQ loop repeat